MAAAYNGVRNIDDAIRGAVVVVGNRGGVIHIEDVRQALDVFVVRIEVADSSMADACAPAILRQRGDGQQGEEQGHRKEGAQKP